MKPRKRLASRTTSREIRISKGRGGSTAGMTAARLSIDVLAFPPDAAELQRWQTREVQRWLEIDQRARVALFFGAGMFLAWAADVGAAFGDGGDPTIFGVASVPIAIVVVLAHVGGRWALERANRGNAEVQRRYADVTLREARPLLEFASNDSVVAQYLRCVGRQGRALRKIERVALHAWMKSGSEASTR